MPLLQAFGKIEKKYRGEIDPMEFGACKNYDELLAMLKENHAEFRGLFG